MQIIGIYEPIINFLYISLYFYINPSIFFLVCECL